MTNLPRITEGVMEALAKKNGHIIAIAMLAVELDRLEGLIR